VHSYTKSLLAAVPYPDLSRPLDFSALNLEGASDSSDWAPHFRDDEEEDLAHVDLGYGHIVLAKPGVDARELRI
jgi:peptide/nickel transport system ATP-binding protein